MILRSIVTSSSLFLALSCTRWPVSLCFRWSYALILWILLYHWKILHGSLRFTGLTILYMFENACSIFSSCISQVTSRANSFWRSVCFIAFVFLVLHKSPFFFLKVWREFAYVPIIFAFEKTVVPECGGLQRSCSKVVEPSMSAAKNFTQRCILELGMMRFVLDVAVLLYSKSSFVDCHLCHLDCYLVQLDQGSFYVHVFPLYCKLDSQFSILRFHFLIKFLCLLLHAVWSSVTVPWRMFPSDFLVDVRDRPRQDFDAICE